MKLVKLSCDQPSFKSITFNSEGVTLILGDRLNSQSDDGSSNGVGKTLSLNLIHHCLGAKPDKKLSGAVADWIFRLDVRVGNDAHSIQRSGDGKRIWLDGQPIRIGELREWLNESGPFDLSEKIQGLTFRSLFSRFARLKPQDCENPVRTSAESPFDALLRSSFLLGIDVELIISKYTARLELDAINKTKANWKTDKILHETFRTGTNPKVRANWLEGEIKRLEADLKSFQIAEDYRQIELTAGDMTKNLREIETSQQVIKFQLNSIEQSLTRHPDISRDDLLALYSGLEKVFKDEALKHFEAVEEFHSKLITNREQRLTKEKIQLESQLAALEDDWQSLSSERDKLLESLNGKRALDEFAALAQKSAELKEERDRLAQYLSFTDRLQEHSQKIREKLLKEDRQATDYANSMPLRRHAFIFEKLVGMLYPGLAAGIVLEPNTGSNQIRYELLVSIEGDDSDGINSARIIIFDWILALFGSNHTMGFVWHDNRLFAHIDPLQRARWFSFIHSALANTGKQYVASLNTENFDAMLPHLSDNELSDLKQSIAVVLRGDDPKNKLLGIQFGSQA